MAVGLPTSEDEAPVNILNASGRGSFVLLCDHASNRMPPAFGDLGLTAAERREHIAWDPGALGVSLELSRLLNAPLVYSTVSRLIIDCNRAETASDLIPTVSELTPVPGNKAISEDERTYRIAFAHQPFHCSIDTLVDDRLKKLQPTALVSIHTYTPTYKGTMRPWEIGLISDADRRLADPALRTLASETSFQVGDNEPYSPSDGVYYTLERHGRSRELMSLMIEIRNDEVTTPEDEAKWARLLARVLTSAFEQANHQAAGDMHA